MGEPGILEVVLSLLPSLVAMVAPWVSVQVKEEALVEAVPWKTQAPETEEGLVHFLAKDFPASFRMVGEPPLLEGVPSLLAPSVAATVAPWLAVVQVK